MNTHQLKIHPEHYNNVLNGTKTFEIRVNDRGFQKGDIVVMYYWPRDADKNYSIHHYAEIKGKKPLKYKVGDVYPVDSDRVVFSILELYEK